MVYMAFSKSFPKKDQKSIWEEVFLTQTEEQDSENEAQIEHYQEMKKCIGEAKKIVEEQSLKPFQSDIIKIAISLFEKRASHVVYYKERKAKDKFDKK